MPAPADDADHAADEQRDQVRGAGEWQGGRGDRGTGGLSARDVEGRDHRGGGDARAAGDGQLAAGTIGP
jgi:hypothetical protein